MKDPALGIRPLLDASGCINGAEVFSTTNKACYARQYTCFVRSSDNKIEKKSIDPELYSKIEQLFYLKGDTECFTINSSGEPSESIKDPSQVRHKLTSSETSFTSTGAKLDYHWPIFKKLQNTGYSSIIRSTLTLHQRCSSKCPYCSTISRNASDSITLDEAKQFVMTLYDEQASYNRTHFKEYNDLYKHIHGCDIRLRGLILSGGGQPNLWPHFGEFVEWLKDLDISLGLITNGFPRNINEDVYGNFDWIRISITPEDASPHYVDGRFDRQYLPSTIVNNKSLTVGYSYVYGSWTNPEILKRISESILANGFQYCRLLTDCNLTRSSQLEAHQRLADMLLAENFIDGHGNPKDKLFHQLKYHGTRDEALNLWEDGQCFLQSYNVFWDTTGHDKHGYSYCYPCDSVTVLTEETEDSGVSQSERKFNSSIYGTVANTEVSRLFREPLRPFFDPRKECSSCLFMKNNLRVKQLSSDAVDASSLPSNINNSSIQHVNFP